jgi:hypothetical protein
MRRTWELLIVAGLGLALAAGPAQALQQNGFQRIVDFEDQALGTHGFQYSGLDTFVSGGAVEDAATSGFTPHSGDRLYVGTEIRSQQTNGDLQFSGVDLWWAIGAFVSPGDAAVTASFYGYDPDSHSLVLLSSVQTSGSAPDQYLDATWTPGDPWLIDVTFSSTSPFAVDDLTLGLPDQPFGIPEPEAWALMLLGFAGVGAGLRARRASAAGVC